MKHEQFSREIFGRIYDIQGFSVQDGPGIRTTVFLKGCPLHCPWCHSPESQAFYPQLTQMTMRCIGTDACGKCLSVCPKDAISLGGTRENAAMQEVLQMVHIDRTRCDNCGICVEKCFPGGLSICGKEYPVDKVMERVSRDIPFYQQSNGGVTVSGGEALSQIDFTESLLHALKGKGIHTALDTTGYAPTDRIDRVLPYVDLYLYDLKHMNSDKHAQVVGVPNEMILQNAKYIASKGGKMQIRIPVIPRFNDDDENIKATAAFCRDLGEAVTMVQLLPYHSLGATKILRLDDTKKVVEAVPPSDEKMNHIKSIFEGMGVYTTIH